MTRKKKKNMPKGIAKRFENEEQDLILKAWKRGERSIDEIVEITGLPRKKVTKYIPISREG